MSELEKLNINQKKWNETGIKLKHKKMMSKKKRGLNNTNKWFQLYLAKKKEKKHSEISHYEKQQNN